MIENIEKCLGCLNSKGVATDGLLARDLHQGNLKSVLGLFFSLSRYKQLLQQEDQERRKKAAAGGGNTVAQQRAQNAKHAQPPPPPRPNGHSKPSSAQLRVTGARLAVRPQATVNGTSLSFGEPSSINSSTTSLSVASNPTRTQGRAIPNGSSRANGNNNNIAGQAASRINGSYQGINKSSQNLTSGVQKQTERQVHVGASNGVTQQAKVAPNQSVRRVAQSGASKGREAQSAGRAAASSGRAASRSQSPPSHVHLNGANNQSRGRATQEKESTRSTSQQKSGRVTPNPHTSGRSTPNPHDKLGQPALNGSRNTVSVDQRRTAGQGPKQRSLSPSEQAPSKPTNHSTVSSSSSHGARSQSGASSSGYHHSSGRSSGGSVTSMPKPQTRPSHGATSTAGVVRRQPPAGSSSQNSGSSSARSSSSDMGSRIPTPNSGPAAPRGGGLKAPGQRNSIGASISNDKSRGPSPVPNSHGAIPGSKKTSSSQVHQSSSGIPSTSSTSNMKPPGSGLAAPRSQTRSPSPGMASKGGAGSSSKLDAASKSKARSSSVPAGQKGIPTPKSSAGGAGKPPLAAGGGGGGDKAGSKIPPANNGKGSMLTKLKIFGKDGKGPPPAAKEKEPEKPKDAVVKSKPAPGKSSIAKPLPPKRDSSSGRQAAPAKKPAAKESKLAPPSKVEKKVKAEEPVPESHESRVARERTNSNGAVSPGLTLGSSSPKNALKAVAQKTIGRAFGGAKPRTSPKLGHKEYVQSDLNNSDLSDEGSKLPMPESKLKSRLPLHSGEGDGSVKSDILECGKMSGLKMPSNKMSTSKVKPVQTVTSQQHGGPSGASQIPSSRGIPKPGSTQRSGLKAPGATAAKKTEPTPSSEKESEEKVTYTRGGAYSPVPPKPPLQTEPIPILDSEKAVVEPSKSPVVKTPSSGGRNSITTSPSHNRSPANTATVAPFNYTGSRPPSKDCSDTISIAASNETDSANGTPIHSQISISSTTSQSSENSVIFQPKMEEDFCTTVYKNDKAVTTFGSTPKQQPRVLKSIPDVQSSSDYNVTVMNSQVGARPSPVPNRATKETTFGDSITTQLKEPSPEVRQSPDMPNSHRTSSLTRRGSLGSTSKLRSMSTVSIPTESTNDSTVMTTKPDGTYQPLLSKGYLNSMRRTFSNRSHLNDLQFTDQTNQTLIDDCNDYVSEDIASGYVSDGDILHRSAGLGDIGSGYMSEGGGTLYARRIGMSFRVHDGMAAVREYLSKSMDLSDEER
ncbi:neuron navigator 2 isoform X2 [Strongylocentrotus purpuratus]|uniref:Calponin-homology (CH) domain-containing protein n=1 Tax=Strongylocentrotus purpuratus TaxID=7668 RepID=A0A7M7P1U0_STRPU|nr:neuron navigator 2 isoform X2 [Strongylocentrotus purpuratus]